MLTKQWHDNTDQYSKAKKMISSKEREYSRRFGLKPKVGTMRQSYRGPDPQPRFVL